MSTLKKNPKNEKMEHSACRKCGVKNHNLTLSDRVFNCANASCGHVEGRDVHAAVNIQHEAISNFKNYSAATEEITPGEILALPETSNKGSGNRDRGTRKGTKVARQERPNVKYNERQKSFQIKALIRQ